MKGNNTFRKLAAVLVVTLMALMAIGPLPVSGAANANPGVIPPQAQPYGHTYREWGVQFFQWWVSMPIPDNPVFDETGALCTEAQSGPVWYLLSNTGGTTVRNCTIPLGKALMIVPAASECSAVEPDPYHGGNEAEMRACAHRAMDDWLTDAAIEVDGVPVTNLLSNYKFDTPLYNLSYPENSVLGVPGSGITQSVGEGAYVMLAPLSVGQHMIYLSYAYGDPLNFSGEVTYNLTIGH